MELLFSADAKKPTSAFKYPPLKSVKEIGQRRNRNTERGLVAFILHGAEELTPHFAPLRGRTRSDCIISTCGCILRAEKEDNTWSIAKFKRPCVLFEINTYPPDVLLLPGPD